MGKSETIKNSLKQTRERRNSQECKVYTVKIDKSHLNLVQKEKLKMMFIEAKWLHNHILNEEDIFSFNTKIKEVNKKNKEGEFEQVELNNISAQMKQGVHDRMKYSVKGLSVRKKNGGKTGRLKFKSEINSIPLKQAGGTHKIVSSKRIKLQGIKKPILVRGLDQLPEDFELANANLIKRQDDYFIALTVFVEKKEKIEEVKETIGIDFGIKDSLITSDGRKFNISIGESEKLKRLSRSLNRKKKGSKSWYDAKKKLQKEYSHIANKRKDISNKIINELGDNYVIIQDENIKGWHSGWFGKQVQNSAMGRIKSELKKSETTIVVDRWFPSTKICPVCGNKEKLTLNDRVYHCSHCGFFHPDRDIKAAKTILIAGLSIGTERINNMPVEPITSAIWKDEVSHQFPNSKLKVLKQEAQCL